MTRKKKEPRYSSIPFSPGSEEEEEEWYRQQRAKRAAEIAARYMSCPHCLGTGLVERQAVEIESPAIAASDRQAETPEDTDRD